MIKIKRLFIISVFTLMASYLLLMTGFCSVLLAAAALTVILFLFFIVRKAEFSKVLLIVLAFITASMLSFSLFEAVREKENALTGYGKEIHGTVTDIIPDENGSIKYALLSDCIIDNTKIFSKITLYPDGKTDLSPGDRINFTAAEIYAAEDAGIFKFHSLSDRCHLSCYNKDGEYRITEKLSNIYISVLKIRNYSAEKLKAALDGDAFSVANALFTGAKDAVSPELSLAFRICGISHIFAVSGMHLSLWTGLFFIIFKRKAKASVIPNIAAGIFVLFYMVFTGFSPSVLRSGIMLISVFAARIIRRSADTLNSLGLSGTILLILNPYLAGNVSFLLSFTATGAIALWDEYLLPEKKVFTGTFSKIKTKLISPFYDITISAAVILTTLPVVSLFFGYFSLLSPVVSLMVTPLAEAIMITSAFLVILPQSNVIFSLFSLITEALCNKVTDTVFTFSQADFMLIPAKIHIILPCFAAAAVTAAVFLIFFRNGRKALVSILSFTLIFAVLTASELFCKRNETEIVIFGRENATLICVSDGPSASAVIGAGGSYSLMSELTSYLNSKAIVKADLLFIPREKDTENRNTDYLKKTIFPRSTVHGSFLSEPLDAALNENLRLYSITEDDFCASVLYTRGIKIVICPLPSADFTEDRSEFLNGDILICRSKIPEGLDTDAFSDVIIMTDTEDSIPDYALYPKEKNIKITVKGDSYAIC